MHSRNSPRTEVGSSTLGEADPPPSLSFGVGDTPVVALRAVGRDIGVESLWCKAEYLNPTGSYKDRIAVRACELACSRGQRGLLGTSSGNGAAAAAAAGARAGLDVCILTVPGAPTAKLATARAHGARILPVRGLGWSPDETQRVLETVIDIAGRLGMYPFVTAWRFAPDAMAGAADIAIELSRQLLDLDVVYVPVGGGGLLTSIWHHYRHTNSRPRLVAVQPSGSSTLDRACRGDLRALEHVTTSISGLQVPALFDPEGAVDAVVSSGGHVTVVDDEAVWDMQALLARRDGVLLEPAGAVAAAGAAADRASGRLAADARVAVIGSGAGWKDGTALERMSTDVQRPEIDWTELESAIIEMLR